MREPGAHLYDFPGRSWRLRWGGDFQGWSSSRWNEQLLAAIDAARPLLEPLAIELQLGRDEDAHPDAASWTDDLLVAPGLPLDVVLAPTYTRGAVRRVLDLGPATLREQVADLIERHDAPTIMRLETRACRAMLAHNADVLILDVGHADGVRIAVERSSGHPAVVGPVAAYRTQPPLAITVDDSMGVELVAHWSYWSDGEGRVLVDGVIAALQEMGWRQPDAAF